MNNKPRGYAILITFSETRQGTEVDEQNIKNLFSQLHFIVRVYKDKTKMVGYGTLQHHGECSTCNYNKHVHLLR